MIYIRCDFVLHLFSWCLCIRDYCDGRDLDVRDLLLLVRSMEAQVLQSYGLTQSDFQAGIMAHQADPSLHEVIQDMQVMN
jgi:hypothetical protein